MTVALLAVVYALLLPWLTLYLRMRTPRSLGWRERADPDVGALDRLRQRH